MNPTGALTIPAMKRVGYPAHFAGAVEATASTGGQITPPILGAAYPAFVPQVDGFGNEIAGLRGLALLAPLATYTPWALRSGAPAADDHLLSFLGTYIPLPLDEHARAATADPRPSLEAYYGDKEGFMERVRLGASYLVSKGVLLERDRQLMIDRQSEHWDWLHKRNK